MFKEHEASCFLKSFREKVVNTMTYIGNLYPFAPLNFRLPKEMWIGKERSLSHQRFIISLVYIHINSMCRGKLDEKSRTYYFLCNGRDNLGYHLWDDVRKKFEWMRDVIFDD